MSASRNLAIENAGGEFITFLDSDDYFFPNKLEQQLHHLLSNPEAVMVCSRAQYWHSWTGNPEDRQGDFVQNFKIELDTLIEAPAIFMMFLSDKHATLCDVLVRKEIVDEVGGYEDSFWGMHEDMVFHSKICLKYPVYVSGDCWYRYRQHSESCTYVSFDGEHHREARGIFLSWLKKYLLNEGLYIQEATQLVESEIWINNNPKLAYYRDRQVLKKVLRDILKIVLPKRTNEWLKNQWRHKH
jgi:glycosyltransferase involved in cell wall biosynthesis